MRMLILMMIRKLVNFVDEIQIPDIEPQSHDDTQKIINAIWGKAYFAPFFRTRERRLAECNSGGSSNG